MHLGSVDLKYCRVDVIDGGSFRMDGGTVFGVVPKALWSKVAEPDEENRVRMSFMSLLVRSDEATVVVEAGSAAHQGEKIRDSLSADEPRLVETLLSINVLPDEVDFFIPTHLHFDHVGGASSADSKGLVFPRAKYVVQKAEWAEARSPVEINKNAYLAGDVEPLEKADLLFVDGEVEITPGVRVALTGGHSVGHQVVKVGSGGRDSVVYMGDLLPTSEHANPRWLCAFDLFPVETFNAKAALLAEAASTGGFLASAHGGKAPLCTVAETTRGKFVAQRVSAVSPTQ